VNEHHVARSFSTRRYSTPASRPRLPHRILIFVRFRFASFGLKGYPSAYTITHTAVSAPTSTKDARHEANATSNAINGGVSALPRRENECVSPEILLL